LGFTEEFRLWAYSTRVRQWSLLSPDRDAAGRDALNAIVSTIGRG
jgi:hypothetical protein